MKKLVIVCLVVLLACSCTPSVDVCEHSWATYKSIAYSAHTAVVHQRCTRCGATQTTTIVREHSWIIDHIDSEIYVGTYYNPEYAQNAFYEGETYIRSVATYRCDGGITDSEGVYISCEGTKMEDYFFEDPTELIGKHFNYQAPLTLQDGSPNPIYCFEETRHGWMVIANMERTIIAVYDALNDKHYGMSEDKLLKYLGY